MTSAVTSSGPGPKLRAYSVGSELVWELTHDRMASAARPTLLLLFRTRIDRVTGRWSLLNPTGDGGLTSIVRYDANGGEVLDGGAEVSFVRLDGLASKLSHVVPDLPARSLWKVVACREF